MIIYRNAIVCVNNLQRFFKASIFCGVKKGTELKEQPIIKWLIVLRA